METVLLREVLLVLKYTLIYWQVKILSTSSPSYEITVKKAKIKWHPCNKKDQGISESGRKTAYFRSVTTSLALLWLLVLPHHNFSMEVLSWVLLWDWRRGKNGEKEPVKKPTKQKTTWLLCSTEVLLSVAAQQEGVWCSCCWEELRDGAWRGERGGLSILGSVPCPELCSELLQQLLRSCRGRRGGEESMECSASPIHRESWILSYYYSTDCKYLGDIYMVFLFKYIMFSFKSITILKRPVRGSDM